MRKSGRNYAKHSCSKGTRTNAPQAICFEADAASGYRYACCVTPVCSCQHRVLGRWQCWTPGIWLVVEMDVQRVPVIQRRVIALCNQSHRPVITATQMLNSMEHSSRPTRAEASDVFNTVL